VVRYRLVLAVTAQINSGNLITTEEKGVDDWYVRNASLWLDLRIAYYTIALLFSGERRFEQAVHEAVSSDIPSVNLGRPVRATIQGR
jgi:hypothetical protein